MSLVARKPAFCICENIDADKLRGYRKADQRLCFHYIDSTILFFLNPKLQASSHLLGLYSLVCVGPGRKPRRTVFSLRGSNIIKDLVQVKSACSNKNIALIGNSLSWIIPLANAKFLFKIHFGHKKLYL